MLAYVKENSWKNTIFTFYALKSIREVVYNFDSNMMQSELMIRGYPLIVLVKYKHDRF